MTNNHTKIILENKLRLDNLFCKYDPITGEGSMTERFNFVISSRRVVRLPVSMKEIDIIGESLKFGSLELLLKSVYCANYSVEILSDVLKGIMKDRIKHDFEYWAYTCCKIKDKESSKQIPFLLNRPQRRYLAMLMEMFFTGTPIRVILCKARQWGGSTLTQLFFFWIQLFWEEGWSSCIVGDVEKQSRIIRAMIKNVAKHHPIDVLDITLRPFEQSKDLVIEGTTTTISVGSMQKPDNLRSDNIYLAHLSEVGLWKETSGKKPEDLIQAIAGGVAPLSHSAVVIESTAKGVGNYFHSQYINAKSGKSSYKHFFVPWWEIERYSKKIKNYEEFISTMNEYDWWLWEIGACLESINYYKEVKKLDFSGSTEGEWRMMEELPSTDEEAFQSSGQRVFPRPYVTRIEKLCREPLFTGDIFGDADTGKNCLNNLGLHADLRGLLKVWVKPDFGEERYSNRYVVIVDIGGLNKKADNSVITVMDNLYTKENGRPEVCARWVGHIDQDKLAWKSAQIARYYHNALLVIENNSLDRESVEGAEGYHFETVLNTIKDYYENIYCTQQNIDRIREGIPAIYGWNTNKKSKGLITDFFYKTLRENMFIEYDLRACNEMDQFERKPDGTMGAKEGCHDDILMTDMTGVYVCFNDSPTPVLINKNNNYKKKVGGVSTF